MNEILTVSELTLAIKKHLEPRFSALTVKGEVTNFKEQSSGHLYFTLKDQDSQVSAVLFRGNSRGLSRLPKNGDQIIVKGELSLYTPRGNYQILVREVQFAGVGELLLKLHELKAKLQQKGWFDSERKKPLPTIPRTIGVVTSPTGSVIQDILNILTRRFKGFHLILNPVKVQGEGAAEEIAKAIREFNEYGLADVLIVGRGGGSLEDLWAFNEEIVAKAIFESKIPVISAVGHETDFTIADYVADVRAPTPSAAAEIAIAQKSEHLHFLNQTKKRLIQTVQHISRQNRGRLEKVLHHPFFSSSMTLLGKYHQLLDGAKESLDLAVRAEITQKKLHVLALQKQKEALKPTTQIASIKDKLARFEKTLYHTVKQQLLHHRRHLNASLMQEEAGKAILRLVQHKRQQLQRLSSHLRSIDPKNLLTKGYCILFAEKKDSVILSTHELKTNQQVCLLLHDGEIVATIDEIK